MDQQELLKKPVEKLGMSEEFVIGCQAMGFGNIGEIIAAGLEAIQKKLSFSYHWLAELSDFLNEKGLLYLLQPLPGNR
jgi:hypothetical protein